MGYSEIFHKRKASEMSRSFSHGQAIYFPILDIVHTYAHAQQGVKEQHETT